MQKRLLIITFSLCAAWLLLGLLPVHGEEEIYDTVVRLHVLANSDSEEDQSLKLAVRDAVLDVTGPLVEGCGTQDEARAVIEAHFPEIQAAAERVIEDWGRTDAVSLEIGLEEYPERTYDSFCFPAGTYVSLRVSIGAAEGQNWWCCLFPPICKSAATVSQNDAEEAFVSVGLTSDQYKIITETDRPVYRVRFKILEVLGSLW